MLLHPKFTVGNLDDFDVVERLMSMSKNQRRMVSAGVGATGGLIASGADDTDDSAGSTAKKMILGAAAGVGAHIGAEYALRNTEIGQGILSAAGVAKEGDRQAAKNVTQQSTKATEASAHINETAEAEKLTEQDSTHKVSDTTKADLKTDAEVKAYKEAKKQKMRGWAKNGQLAGMIGLGVFAVATALDTNESLAENRRTSRMTEEQERNLKRKMIREEKEQKQYSYGYVGMGDIVGELFENRIGHHKMGNAKFQ